MPLGPRRAVRRGVIGRPVARTAAVVGTAAYLLAAAVFGISPAAALAASLARRARDLLLGAGTLGIAAVGDDNFAPQTLSMLKLRQRPRER